MIACSGLGSQMPECVESDNYRRESESRLSNIAHLSDLDSAATFKKKRENFQSL